MPVPQRPDLRQRGCLLIIRRRLRHTDELVGHPGTCRDHDERLSLDVSSDNFANIFDSRGILDGRAAEFHYEHICYLRAFNSIFKLVDSKWGLSPKFQYRNSKQYRNSNSQMPTSGDALTRVCCSEF